MISSLLTDENTPVETLSRCVWFITHNRAQIQKNCSRIPSVDLDQLCRSHGTQAGVKRRRWDIPAGLGEPGAATPSLSPPPSPVHGADVTDCWLQGRGLHS